MIIYLIKTHQWVCLLLNIKNNEFNNFVKPTKVVQHTTNHYDVWSFVHLHWYIFNNPPSILKGVKCIFNIHMIYIHKKMKFIFINCSKVLNFIIIDQVWSNKIGWITKYECKNYNLKIVSYIFFLWMKSTNPNLDYWLDCLRCVISTAPKKLFLMCFLFLVCFVVSQVMTKGT
jgi:hypothetical protein